LLYVIRKNMNSNTFKIELKSIHWYDGTDDEFDRCAHGEVKVIIGNEILLDENTDDILVNISAMCLHLLRTLICDHTEEEKVGDNLIPGEGHHLDHFEEDLVVHVCEAFIKGYNWWVIRNENLIQLKTEKTTITIEYEVYRNQIISFVEKVEEFYAISKPKLIPEDKYDREAYEKFWDEWKKIKQII